MKTKVILIVSILVVFFTSCKKDDLDFIQKPKFVDEQPEALINVNDRVYIDALDLLSAKNGGTFQTENTNVYTDDQGRTVIDRSYRDITYYIMKTRDYWGWSNKVEYASTYKMRYQTTSQVYAEIQDALQNTDHIVCYKQKVWNEFDRFGYGYEITGIVK
jgi:hypothetical protein